MRGVVRLEGNVTRATGQVNRLPGYKSSKQQIPVRIHPGRACSWLSASKLSKNDKNSASLAQKFLQSSALKT